MSYKAFKYSYSDYHDKIESLLVPGIKICEIGPSGKPSIKSSEIRRRGLDYTIIDVETIHWKDYNPEVRKYEVDLQREFSADLRGKFDIVMSQMVLEHIEDPEPFHTNILKILKEGGSAIHLYANPSSFSAAVNRLLPEKVGECILKVIGNRNLDYDQKYKAYYKWCFVSGKLAKKEFGNLGYKMVLHTSYLGHNYFQRVLLLNQLEKLYSFLLLKLNLNRISTLSLLHVKKQ